MLFRKRSKDISRWIDSHENTALLLTGARQTGKTYLIRKCLEEKGVDYVEFNFIESPEIPRLLKEVEDMGTGEFLTRLSIMSDHPMKKGETIIFFDEIQEYKDIATLIKFLVLEGSFRYVLSGSLLGVELKGIRSVPVGYIHTLELFPLDLEEFFMAMGLSKEAFDMLYSCFSKRERVSDAIHKRLMNTLEHYLVVGGMPQAVQSFVDSSDFNKVLEIHGNIIPGYISDFSKYESENRKLVLRRTYDLIPSELAEKNKRFIFNNLDKNFRPEKYEESFQWLISAGVAIPVYNVTEPRIPLILNEKSNLFKLFSSDVGLLSSQYGKAFISAFLNGDKKLNNGALYENFVAQELHAHGFDGYYFNSKKQGEIDFVIEHNLKPLPIEVKSGKDYKIHSALDNVLSNEEYGIETAFVFSEGNVSEEGKVAYLPLYMVMFLKNDDMTLPMGNGSRLDDI